MNLLLKRQLTQIAREHLRIETLDERKSDSLDFHDVFVWGVETRPLCRISTRPQRCSKSERRCGMKTYTVLFAQDVPHYGSVEITATGDVEALAKAMVHWERVQRDEEPWPLNEAQHESAVLDRIVEITDDETGRQVAADIRLDTFLLTVAPTDLSVSLIKNATPMHGALEKIIRHATLGLAANELGKQLKLDQILSIARAVLARVEGGAA
jgi:hypothetical protein